MGLRVNGKDFRFHANPTLQALGDEGAMSETTVMRNHKGETMYSEGTAMASNKPAYPYQNAQQASEAKPTMELPQAMEQLDAARVRLIDLTKELHVRLQSALSPSCPSAECPQPKGRVYGSPLATAIDEQCRSLWISIESIEDALRRIQL